MEIVDRGKSGGSDDSHEGEIGDEYNSRSISKNEETICDNDRENHLAKEYLPVFVFVFEDMDVVVTVATAGRVDGKERPVRFALEIGIGLVVEGIVYISGEIVSVVLTLSCAFKS